MNFADDSYNYGVHSGGFGGSPISPSREGETTEEDNAMMDDFCQLFGNLDDNDEGISRSSKYESNL